MKEKINFNKNNELADLLCYLFGNCCNEKVERTNKTTKCDNSVKNSSEKYRGFKMSNMENESGVLLEYLVPGVKKENLKVSFDETICCVTCEQEVPYFGELKSKVKMNFEIDYEKISSKLEDGILKIYIYKVKNDSNKIVSIDIN